MTTHENALHCRICNGTDYTPLVQIVADPGMPHGVDIVHSSRARCVQCGNIVDIFDVRTIRAYVFQP